NWRSIIDRCTVKGHTAFKNYGGRGIKFNLDWYTDFWLFVKEIESLGPKPTPRHTLDRIDNNGDYIIENLRWADKSLQSSNQRAQKNNTTNVVGVSFSSRDGVWEAKRQRNYKTIRKRFKTKEEAIAFLQGLDHEH
ncbi:MAG: hypothetical protein GTO02_02985, partial [Candidatus Dadabacteria bacterium]|nr:hypothetical protein [Candidatus Dadabacteria bacterium]